MSKSNILVTESISEEVLRVIGGGLDSFNDAVTGYGDRRPLAVIVKDPESGEILGGATGRTSLGLLFLDLFYLPTSLRGEGLGSRILEMFENAGRKRGCLSAVLYTISFQAPGFYQRHGWRVFGEIACEPAGTRRVFMSKVL